MLSSGRLGADIFTGFSQGNNILVAEVRAHTTRTADP